jgi:hypothetical protein
MRKILFILSLLFIFVLTSCQKHEQSRVRAVYGHDIIEYYDGDKLKTAFIGFTNYIVVLNADNSDELTIIEKKEGKTIQISNNE